MIFVKKIMRFPKSLEISDYTDYELITPPSPPSPLRGRARVGV
jgi:hypothetical protein